jgi:hypothetical protein
MFNYITLSTIAIILSILLYRWHSNPLSKFNLSDAIVDENGKFSLFRAGQATALIISSWAFIILVQQGTLTEYYFYGYMGIWSGVNLARNLLGKAPDAITDKA